MDGMVETECWEKGNTVEGHPAWPCSHHWIVPPVFPKPESSYSQAILGVPWHLGSQVVLEDPAKQGRYGDGPALNLSVTLSLCESDPNLKTWICYPAGAHPPPKPPTPQVQLLFWAISQPQVTSPRPLGAERERRPRMRWGGADRHTSVDGEGRRGTSTPARVAKSQNTYSSQDVQATWTPSSVHLRGVRPFLLKLPALLDQG